MISFNVNNTDHDIIQKIAERAMRVQAAHRHHRDCRKLQDFLMDITAVHANGCRLDLDRLLAADDFNFSHDVFGIERHLNRQTGQLEDCFLPRFAMRSQRLEPSADHALKATVLDKVGRIDHGAKS